MSERQGIVGTQRFDICDFKPGVLHAALNVADGIELTVWKDVAINKLGGTRFVPSFDVMGDAMVQKQACGFKQAVNC